MVICFSTGFCTGWNISKVKAVSFLKNISGLAGVELMFYTPKELADFLASFDDYEFLQSMPENSIHIPVKDIVYAQNSPSFQVLEAAVRLYKKIHAKRIIVHSNLVQDFKIFDSLGAFFCIENLSYGKEKTSMQTPSQIKEFLFEHEKFGFCLDTCHAMSNGIEPKAFFGLGDLISQVHASSAKGFGLEQTHTPLYKTAKKNLKYIVPALTLQKPVIIESVLPVNDSKTLRKEFDFVNRLSNARKP